jgi:hypothetical protein
MTTRVIRREEPFRQKPRRLWLPNEMRTPPRLDSRRPPAPIERRYALLVNPFYPKDPHASFGKHVLTPTLALTSVAGATPPEWKVMYWDENLLQGPPPANPTPEVVGITVHLTFAARAYELAAWYRARGSRVILGGLHVLSCPDEASLHADALAIGDGVPLWPRILRDVENGALQPVYRAAYDSAYRDDPPPRRDLLPRRSFLTTSSLIATRGCHNRCGFCYLSTEDLYMPYRVRGVEQIAREFLEDGQPYGVFVDNNLGSKPDYLRALCRALAPLGKIWSAALTIDRDWNLYDTAHVVFRPKRMTQEELAQGYSWLYQRLFSHASIWHRRPSDWRAVMPYLAMSYLYKRSNRFWHFLIRRKLVSAAWRPLVELTRRRHLKFRRELAARCEGERTPRRGRLAVTPGV